MNLPRHPWRREPEGFAADPRPGANQFVYCKGCGEVLEGRAPITRRSKVVQFMMCEACRTLHGHPLAPAPGSPSFCYRCGGPDELFVSTESSPATYRVCPRCAPARAARYRAQDFEPPATVPPKQQ
jgi:hypothetical protein